MGDKATPAESPKPRQHPGSPGPDAKSPLSQALLPVFPGLKDQSKAEGNVDKKLGGWEDPMEENAEALLVLASAGKTKRPARSTRQKEQEVDAARVLVGFGVSPGGSKTQPKILSIAEPKIDPKAQPQKPNKADRAKESVGEEPRGVVEKACSREETPMPEQVPAGPKYRLFRLARAFARELGFEAEQQWQEWAKRDGSALPDDVPVNPNEIYAGNWLGWEDFLMTETVRKEKLMETLRAIGLDETPLDVTPVRSTRSKRTPAPATPLSLKSPAISKTPGSPAGPKPSRSPRAKPKPVPSPRAAAKPKPTPPIPSEPPAAPSVSPQPVPKAEPAAKAARHVANEDFQPRKPLLNGRWLAYEDAREFAIGLGFSTYKEWTEWCATGKRPDFVPSSPNQTYERTGWVSWLVFFGIVGATEYPPAPAKAGKGTFSSFSDSRSYVRALRLGNSHRNWRIWGLSRERPLQVPLHPDKVFKRKGWVSWKDWLAGPGTSSQPTGTSPQADPDSDQSEPESEDSQSERSEAKTEPETGPEAEPETETGPEAEPETGAEPGAETGPGPETEAEPETETETETGPEPETGAEAEPEPEPEAPEEPEPGAEVAGKGPQRGPEAPGAAHSDNPKAEETERGSKRPGGSVPEPGPRKRLAARALEMAAAATGSSGQHEQRRDGGEQTPVTTDRPGQPHPSSCSVSSNGEMFLSSRLEVVVDLRDQAGSAVALERFPEGTLRAEPLGSLCCSPSGSGDPAGFTVSVDVGSFLRDPFSQHAVQWLWTSGGQTTVVATLTFGQITVTEPEADRYRHEVQQLAEDLSRRAREAERTREAFSEMGLTDQAGWHGAQLKMLGLLTKFYKECFGVAVESSPE